MISLAAYYHRAPLPEDEPLPSDPPPQQDEPSPHPDPVVTHYAW